MCIMQTLSNVVLPSSWQPKKINYASWGAHCSSFFHTNRFLFAPGPSQLQRPPELSIFCTRSVFSCTFTMVYVSEINCLGHCSFVFAVVSTPAKHSYSRSLHASAMSFSRIASSSDFKWPIHTTPDILRFSVHVASGCPASEAEPSCQCGQLFSHSPLGLR